MRFVDGIGGSHWRQYMRLFRGNFGSTQLSEVNRSYPTRTSLELDAQNGPLTVRGDRIGPKAAASLHYYRRTEPGFDGLAGTNLRFSEQGGP